MSRMRGLLMYEYECNGISIKIKIDKGLYSFPRRSATGKSYLGYLLNCLRTMQRVRVYTYENYCDGVSLKSILSSEKYDVVYLDRSDHYYEEFIADLLEFSKKHLALMDAKYVNHSYPIGIAALFFCKERIEVLASVVPF